MSSSTTTSVSSNTTTSSSQHQPLTDLSPNTTSPRKPTDTTDPFKPIQSTKDEKSTTSQDQAATYISPSDAMLSPTTKKLSEIKGRRFASAKTGQMGSRALFQKAVMQGKENDAAGKKQGS